MRSDDSRIASQHDGTGKRMSHNVTSATAPIVTAITKCTCS